VRFQKTSAMTSGAGGPAAGLPPAKSGESLSGPRDGRRSRGRPGSACSPTSDSPSPSSRRADGSPTGHYASRISRRTSTCGQSTGDAIGARCRASRLWQSPVKPHVRPGALARPAGVRSSSVRRSRRPPT
jgi:hypothetical protein